MASTSDIGLAATWLALGAEYDRTDRQNPRKMTFYFKSKLVADDDQPFPFTSVERDYMNEVQLVNAKRLIRAYNAMKSVVHSNSEEGIPTWSIH